LGDFIEKFTAMDYGEAKWKDLDIIVVATEAGPLPDCWRPEEGK
jgi:hypothetical protein